VFVSSRLPATLLQRACTANLARVHWHNYPRLRALSDFMTNRDCS